MNKIDVKFLSAIFTVFAFSMPALVGFLTTGLTDSLSILLGMVIVFLWLVLAKIISCKPIDEVRFLKSALVTFVFGIIITVISAMTETSISYLGWYQTLTAIMAYHLL